MIRFLILLLLVGCAKPTLRREGRFAVEVESAGSRVEDFEQNLVHRVTIDRQALTGAIGQANFSELFTGLREFDGAGKVRGLKLGTISPRVIQLGIPLQVGDVVTAVNRTQVKDLPALDELVTALRSTSGATMTFERAATPHKVIFYLAEL